VNKQHALLGIHSPHGVSQNSSTMFILKCFHTPISHFSSNTITGSTQLGIGLDGAISFR